MGVPTVKPDHHAVEAARREVRSSLVAKYAKYAMKSLGKDSPEPFDVKACITSSQANAFKGTLLALGKNTEEIKSRLAADFRREFAKLKVV
jgi:hypothetical protein